MLRKEDDLRILVTGGAGFIGSNFIRIALEENRSWEIINFDLLTYAGNLKSLEDIKDNPRYSFIRGDIANPADFEKVFDQPMDIIINFAAETHVDKSLYNAAEFVRTNVSGVAVLLDFALRHKIGRFIQISTDEVYGSRQLSEPAFETDPLNPSSPYAASKASAELLCLSYRHTFSLPIIITRSCNNYGPYQFPEKLIPFFISETLAGRQVPLYGKGDNIRNWMHVYDNCRAILAVIQKGNIGEIYNIASHEYIDNLSLAKKLLSALGKPDDLIKFVTDRPGHDHCYSINSDKIRSICWDTTITFEEGLPQTIEWYRANGDWLREILSGEHLNFYEKHYKNR